MVRIYKNIKNAESFFFTFYFLLFLFQPSLCSFKIHQQQLQQIIKRIEKRKIKNKEKKGVKKQKKKSKKLLKISLLTYTQTHTKSTHKKNNCLQKQRNKKKVSKNNLRCFCDGIFLKRKINLCCAIIVSNKLEVLSDELFNFLFSLSCIWLLKLLLKFYTMFLSKALK